MGANVMASNICADGDTLYVRTDSKCLKLDGRTGRQLAAFATPGAGVWGFIAVADGTLFGTIEQPVKVRWFQTNLTKIGQEIKDTATTEGGSLFAMDARTGKVKWTYQAEDLIPHNGIAIGGGKVYLIDRPNMSVKVAEARRRGLPAPSTEGGRLVALEADTGKVLWKNEKGISGTLLALSVDHGVLVMGFPTMRRGNMISDLGNGLAAFSAADGKRLWEKDIQYLQRPLIVGGMVLVEPGGWDWKTARRRSPRGLPCAWDLLTGEPKKRRNPVSGEQENWTFGSSGKCSGWTTCENMLFFRTSTISYFDLTRDEGTAYFGGIRPSCYINVLPVGGIVVAPDTFTGCTGNFLHRTSIAMQPMPQQEHWTLYNGQPPRAGIVRHLALNLGAPGDRRDADGVLWLAVPRPVVQMRASAAVDARAFMFDKRQLTVDCEENYHRNADTAGIAGTDSPWITASGGRGPVRIAIDVSKMPARTAWKVRLHFAELDGAKPGERVFDVKVQGKTVLEGFDIAEEVGPNTALVKEFDLPAGAKSLDVQLVPKKGKPILAGIEALAVAK